MVSSLKVKQTHIICMSFFHAGQGVWHLEAQQCGKRSTKINILRNHFLQEQCQGLKIWHDNQTMVHCKLCFHLSAWLFEFRSSFLLILAPRNLLLEGSDLLQMVIRADKSRWNMGLTSQSKSNNAGHQQQSTLFISIINCVFTVTWTSCIMW